MWRPTGNGDAIASLAAMLQSALGLSRGGGGVDGVTPEPVGRLSRSACTLPELFAMARGQLDIMQAHRSESPHEHEDHSVFLTAERNARAAALAPIAEALNECSSALGDCAGLLAPTCRQKLQNVMRTLQTEYVRLRDAQTYLFDRRLRLLRTGEPDLDPEFTIVLERVVYGARQGDEVSNSVARAVQAIASELLPYVAEDRD